VATAPAAPAQRAARLPKMTSGDAAGGHGQAAAETYLDVEALGIINDEGMTP